MTYMTCNEAEPYIAAYVAGDYDNIPDVEELEYHMAECEQCSHEYEKYLELTIDLAQHADLLAPDSEVTGSQLVKISVTADGELEVFEWDGSEMVKTVEAQNSLSVRYGDREVFNIEKSEAVAARSEAENRVELEDCIIEVQPGRFQDTIIIKPKD